MVDHAKRFYENSMSLTPPREVVDATLAYIKNEDIIGQFFDACVTADQDGCIKSSDFHAEFIRWAKSEGHEEKLLPKIKTFSTQAEKQFDKDKSKVANVFRVRIKGMI
jgi:hypothetical protein